MTDNFTNIDEYIACFEEDKRQILIEVRELITKNVPDAAETINYKMPTFRLNGNLIHFAMFKNHLGLYPGVDAIVHFQDKLSSYKTSKGAIQIPLNVPIPTKLIQEIILYKVDLLKDNNSPDWKKYNEKWSDANEKIQQLVNQTELQKEFKWGGEVYTYNKKNVLAFSGFKNHFALWFYNGVLLIDKDKILIAASEGKTKALRQWRFTSSDEMNLKKIKQYIDEAIQLVKNGKEIKPEKSIPKEVNHFLQNALNQNDNLNSSFKALTKGKQKDYNEYIDEAKQEKTKVSRLEKIIPLILDGKGLHDKYKK